MAGSPGDFLPEFPGEAREGAPRVHQFVHPPPPWSKQPSRLLALAWSRSIV